MIKFLTIIFISLSFASLALAAGNGVKCASGADCLSCHAGYEKALESVMASKSAEKAFIASSAGMFDGDFSEKNCSGCHVSSCSDCHSENNGRPAKPSVNDCLKCHRDVFTGAEYAGMGIREDHERYRRGPEFMGENYMKMLPDVHYEKGMTCGDCHSMKNIMGAEKAKDCLSCHKYDKSVTDHGIKGHDKLECVSCHAAWAPMELGTFYIRTRESSYRQYFDGIRELSPEYLKSSFMRVNERPPLAVDGTSGKYAPIKPSFIMFATDIYKNLVVGMENRPLAARWKVFTPHTVRRETPLCTACHGNDRRFMLEREVDRVLEPDKDGLPFKSFYNGKGFTLAGGRFVTEEEMARINGKTPEYVKKYLEKMEKVKRLINQ